MTTPDIRSVLRRLFATMLLAAILPRAAAAEAESPCSTSGAHDSTLFFLIDRSDSLKDKTSFSQSFAALRQMVRPGERVVAGVVTDQVSRTRIVMDSVKPADSVWESSLKIKKGTRVFNDCLTKLEKEMVENQEEHKSSAILETLGFVEQVLAADPAQKKRVVIYSDMVQNSESLSFYKRKDIQGEELLQLAKKENLLRTFAGVDFFITGAGGGGLTDKLSRGVENFWRAYLSAAKANLKYYGPVLAVAAE